MKIFDLEANGLLETATKMHCLAIAKDSIHSDIVTLYLDKENRKVLPDTWYDDNGVRYGGCLAEGIRELVNATEIIAGHNICGFDLPLLEKMYPKVVQNKFVDRLFHDAGVPDNTNLSAFAVDSFISSCLLYPERYEHGLESWGTEVGIAKPQQEQWEVFDVSMATRCVTDVRLNKKLLNTKIMPELLDDSIKWYNPLALEQLIQYIHAEQESTGVRFDVLKALRLISLLDARIEYLREKILSGTERRVVSPYTVEVKAPYTKAGQPAAMTLKHYDNDFAAIKKANIKGPFTRIDYAQLNLDSDTQVKDYLLKLGWVPTEWNMSKKTRKRTSPKLTEDSYRSLPPGVGQDIAEYNICTHRRGMLANRKGEQTGALWAVRPDGRIAAQAYTCGTPTSRYRHKGVICNIPRPGTPYGKEVRELYTVPSKWWMVGSDLKGIEIRMAAHYAYRYDGGPELAAEILAGDFHQGNADIWGVSRTDSKTGLYALMYGCTPPKLAQALNKPQSQANRLFNDFWHNRAPLKMLNEDLKRAYNNRGFLIGLDGRKLQIREERKLLNTLIQGGSAVVFKRWMMMNQVSIRRSIDRLCHQLIAYHDELQYECRSSKKSVAEALGGILLSNALRAGQWYRLDVPIEADVKIGKNWAECH